MQPFKQNIKPYARMRTRARIHTRTRTRTHVKDLNIACTLAQTNPIALILIKNLSKKGCTKECTEIAQCLHKRAQARACPRTRTAIANEKITAFHYF